jgi:hypothetical protein
MLLIAGLALGSFCDYDIMTPGRGKARRALVEDTRLWADGVIPYSFTAEVDGGLRKRVEAAMRELEEVADVSFLVRPRPGPHLIISTRHPEKPAGCWATVGSYEEAKMNLGWCRDRRHILHELLHVTGMWHEQSRKDSPQYLTMQRSDINDCVVKGTDSRGMKYDFRSIMHYPISSLGGTITNRGKERLKQQKTQQARVGYYSELSPLDVDNLQAMYGLSNGARSRDTQNSNVAAGLIAGGVAVAVLGMFLALT